MFKSMIDELNIVIVVVRTDFLRSKQAEEDDDHDGRRRSSSLEQPKSFSNLILLCREERIFAACLFSLGRRLTGWLAGWLLD